MSYTEPLTQSGATVLEVNYDWNLSSTESIRNVTDFADIDGKIGRYNERQSNHYKYNFTTNRVGVGIRGRREKYNYTVGFQSQPARLSGASVGRDNKTNYRNINWIPSLRFVYNFAHNLTATADGAAREPGFLQLQPVADSSNLNNIVVGNPNLRYFLITANVRMTKFGGRS
jgi:hypothetical protein